MIALAVLLLQVQMGTTVRPETVTVGQHFNVTVRIRVPNGAQLGFPLSTDSSARVDTAASATRRSVAGPQFTETTMNYVLAAWDTGAQHLGLGDVSVGLPSGQRLASLRALSVYVRSVLPIDTAQRKPRPPRPTVAQRVVNWLAWAIVAAVALMLGLAYWFWSRRRGRGDESLTALNWAEREFERIEGAGWLAEGMTERHAIAMAGVVRRYLALVNHRFAASLTTRELASAVAGSPLPTDRLIALMEEVDPLKFAARRLSREAAVRTGAEARSLVAESDRALSAAAASAVADPAVAERAAA
ncbi:MAG: hypothetical protein ACR2MQ_08820 [Gemmatimonadaceae bacterium]